MSDWAFENSARRMQDKAHRHIADAIYRHEFGRVAIRRIDEKVMDESVIKALDILGVDFHVVFSNGTLLSGQEKFLSYKQRGFRTITVSEHSWKHCAAQVYFVGYLTKNGQGFSPWVILNWPNVMIATARDEVKWQKRESNSFYPAFWWAPIDGLPKACLLAQGG